MHRGIERDLELLREYSQKPEASRLDIARRVAVIVAWFVRDYDSLERVITGRDVEVLEKYVRDHADEAEGETLTSTGDIISYTLRDACVLDDYMRIKRGGQHMAFAVEDEGFIGEQPHLADDIPPDPEEG